jgi:dimethylhistidine N-methyltransferase
MIEQFKKDVAEGLSRNPNFLNSKYFYDEIGDELFVDIMNMPEYYLTRSEFEIFSEKTEDLIQGLNIDQSTHFQLIELGAGDGTKTKKLLEALVDQNFKFDYLPIDISTHTLEKLEQSLQKEMPKLNVKTQQGDYFQVLSGLKNPNQKKVVLFLGSNIGNLRDEMSAKFLYELGSNLSPGDRLLLGVDLIKSEDIVLPAYNDAAGITAKFNLNLLHRINKELGGDFDLSAFAHQPEYTKKKGLQRAF